MLDIHELGDFIRRSFTHEMFRLETLDRYEVASDGNDFGRYLAGEPEPDRGVKQPWLDRLQDEKQRGLYRHRVHVVSSPLSDYLRFECEWGYVDNARAGEDIRILDLAEQPTPEHIVDYDFYLIDNQQVLRMHYGENCEFVGAELLPESDLKRHQEVRDATWSAAIPFNQYWSEHPQYWRK